MSPDDYTALSQQLTFTSGQSSSGDSTQCFNVTIADDFIGQKPISYFDVELSTSTSAVEIDSDEGSARVYIAYNRGMDGCGSTR